MKTDTVIFRKWKNGDIIALLPMLPFDVLGLYCTSYEHVGQHGGADCAGVIRRTKAATPAEYAPLKRELEGMGYKLLVVSRNPVNAYVKRKLALKQ